MTNAVTMTENDYVLTLKEIEGSCDELISRYKQYASHVNRLAFIDDVPAPYMITEYVRLANIARFAYLLREKVIIRTDIVALRRWLKTTINELLKEDDSLSAVRWLKNVADHPFLEESAVK